MKIEKKEMNNIQYIQEKYKVSNLCAKVLSHMELDDQAIETILHDQSSLDNLSLDFLNPILLRLQKAKEAKEKILICGDYDCDGICATTIMYDALTKYGIECGYYIPNRFKEGYGLHISTVENARQKGYTLIVTVDNGVKATQALTLAKNYGIEIIITDHHNYEKNEIIADYFLHPNLLDKQFSNMCGAGLAFLISYTLIGLQEKHIILAGIATIGDVVPVLNLNRIIIKKCIELLNSGKYFAIQCLSNDRNVWDETKIAFQIVPKLNSIGRLADCANANTIVRFLLSEDANVIQNVVIQINALNNKRKELSATMEQLALQKIKHEDDFLVVYDETFHEGINGIVASKILAQFQKPVMVLSKSDGILKGSIRSNSVDLTHYFDSINDELLSYGGHKEAAGIGFEENKLALIIDYVNKKIKDEDKEITLCVLPLTVKEISIASIQSLDCLKPFGSKFSLPLFMVEDTDLKLQQMSHGKHLKYEGNSISYLYFNEGRRYNEDCKKDGFTFIGSLNINHFRNQSSVNMIVERIID